MAKDEVMGILAVNSITLSDYSACLLVQVAERFAGKYGDVWQSLISKMITKGFVRKDSPSLPVHFHSKSRSVGDLIITAVNLPEEKIKTLAELSKLFIGDSGVEWVNYISDVILKGLIYNWELDRFGRIIVPVVGKGLTGKQWINFLKEREYDVGHKLEFALSLPGYDSHRLEVGRVYRVAMFFGDSITEESHRRNSSIRDIAKRAYGKKAADDAKLELVLLLRDLFTNDELSSIGIDYVSATRTIDTNKEAWEKYHSPPNIISFSRRCFRLKNTFGAFYYSGADSTWNERGAFPFIVG